MGSCSECVTCIVGEEEGQRIVIAGGNGNQEEMPVEEPLNRKEVQFVEKDHQFSEQFDSLQNSAV